MTPPTPCRGPAWIATSPPTSATYPTSPSPASSSKTSPRSWATPQALKAAVQALAAPYRNANLAAVAAVESRGFIFASAVACELGCGFVPLRKPNKLPAATTSATYELEYGVDTIEVHTDAIRPGDRVAIIDDLIATGGTAVAAVELVERLGGKLVGLSFLIDLAFLGGCARLAGHPIHTVITYNAD